MTESEQETAGGQQYVDAETLLPFGEILRDLRGTDKAVHVGYYSDDKYDDRGARDHHWIAHMPDLDIINAEFVVVRISTSVGSVTDTKIEDAGRYLTAPRFGDWQLAVKDVVDIERTPIPYKIERTLRVECPECDRFGTTHPWKLENYLPDECPCGFGGEWNVQ